MKTILFNTGALKNYAVLSFIFLCFTFRGFGQLLESDSAGFSGKVSLSGSFHTGNLKKTGLVNIGDFFYNSRSGRSGLESHTEYIYTKIFDQVSDNDLLTRTLFFHKITKRWYATAIFWYETNELRRLHPLVQAGPSIEYAWLQQKKNVGGLSIGATYEHKHFDDPVFNYEKYNGERTINTSRLFARLHGKNVFGPANLVFNYDIYYMPSLQYSRNYRVHAESSLDVPVLKWLSLRTSIEYNYESVVVSGVKPNDFAVNYGISIKF